jgi:sodium/proline symporter
VWVVIAFIATLIVGSLGTVYLKGVLSNEVLEPNAAETVFSVSLQVMFPAFIAGIFLCAILAAAMSTADSQLLVASSAFSQDVFKGLIKKDASEKTVLNVSRITVLVIAAIAFALSVNPNSSIFSLVSYAWAGFGATFGPIILLALFWRGTTRNGAIAGLISGGITVVTWHNLKGGIFNVYEILPGFIVCLIFTVVFSLLQKNKDPEMLAEFDAYKKMSDIDC